MPDRLTFHEGALSVRHQPVPSIPAVPEGTSLAAALEHLAATGRASLVITDQTGRLLGVLTRDELLTAQTAADREDQSSTAIPVESLLRMVFQRGSGSVPESASSSVLQSDDLLPCDAVFENGRLTALMLEDDVLVSWRSLGPALESASRDSVTGLLTRLSFETQFAFQWTRCIREVAPLLLIMADLDEFKEINDRCGHVAGDSALRAVGAALKESLRAHDLVARFGGDEFIVLCSHCPPEFAGNLVVRMRDAVQRIDPPSVLPYRRFHLSFGLAGVRSDFRHASAAQLIAEADRCLLRAKAAGKDRAFLCVLDEPDASEPRVVM